MLGEKERLGNQLDDSLTAWLPRRWAAWGTWLARWLVAALLVTIGVLAVFPLLAANFRHDEAVFLVIGREIRFGRLPYRDLWDHKGPLIYLVGYVASFFGSLLVPVARLIAYGLPLSGGLVLARALGLRSRAFTLLWASLGLALSVTLTEGVTTETLEAAAVLWAAAGVVRAERTAGTAWRGWLLAAGVSVGLGVVARLPMVLFGLGLLALLAVWEWRGTRDRRAAPLWLLVGALLPLALTGLVLWQAGLLTAAYNLAWVANVRYAQATPLGELVRSFLWNVLPKLGLFSLLLVFGVPGLATLPTSARLRGLLLALLAMAIMVALYTRAGHVLHYWTTTGWLLTFGSAWTLRPHLLGRGPLAERWVAGCLGFFLLVEVLHYAGATLLSGSLVQSNEPQAVAQAIRPQVPPGSALWVAGLRSPAIYLYGDTHPGTRYLYVNVASLPDFVPETVIADLEASRAAVLVGPDWYVRGQLTEAVPAVLRTHLQTHYTFNGPLYPFPDHPYALFLPK